MYIKKVYKIMTIELLQSQNSTTKHVALVLCYSNVMNQVQKL